MLLGLVLLVLVGLQLPDDAAPRALRTMTAGVGLLLIAAPVVVRAGEQGRAPAAYLNSILCGILVLGLVVVAGRRRAREDRAPRS